MKFLIVALAFVAVAVASPVQPGAGPAPVLVDTYEPVVVGPALLEDFEPIIVGPAVIEDFEQIAVGPAIVNDHEEISVGPAVVELAPAPIVQIVLNFNQQTHVVEIPTFVATPEVVPTPVIIVDDAAFGVPVQVAPAPIQVVEVAPEPVQVVDVAPEPVQVVEVAPVEVGTPILPTPVLNLPDELN